MKENILVIDIGTQSLRASIVNKKGDILAFSKQKYEPAYYSPSKGFAEQNVDFYVDELIKATNEIYQKDNEILSSISSMIMDCFRDSSVILDKDKKPIRKAILWLDQRIRPFYKNENLKWYEKALFTLIGMKDTCRYNSERTPYYWLKENEEENIKKMKYYVPLGAYFNYRVTGNLVISSADCIGHYPINFKKGTYYSKLHPKSSIFGIPRECLPDIVPVSSIIGEVSEEFSLLSKIPVGTKVIASASDKACETLGNGCTDIETASLSLGTACTIDVVCKKYKESETFLPSYQAPYPKSYDLELQVYRGFWMITWYLNEFGLQDKIDAEKENMPVLDYLSSKLNTVPVGCDGLILQPYWGPSLKRPNARGSIIGFSSVHTRYYLYRAMIEGIAFSLKEGLDEIIKRTHKKPELIVVSGGGSSSKEICQIFCDVFDLPMMISATNESSTIGAAMAGFCALKVFSSPEEAKKNMVKEGFKLTPNKENSKLYQHLYKNIYKKIYPSLKKEYFSLKKFFLRIETIND